MHHWARWQLCLVLSAGIVTGLAAATMLPTTVAAPVPSPDSDRRTLERTGQIFETVAELVRPAVVYLESRLPDQAGDIRVKETGSGVLVRPPTLSRPIVVTNLHVVAAAQPSDIDIHLADGRVLQARRVWKDDQTDLALLEPGEQDLPAVKIGDSSQVRIGQWVLAIGSPFGLAQSVTHGIISATQRRQVGLRGNLRIKDFLQTDAAINPGNSGGPLVNLAGEVIGINTAIASRTGGNNGVSFSIPINLVRWVMDELLAHGKVRRAFLGVEFPVRFDLKRARALGLTMLRGAAVETVRPDSPASVAGIRAGDVILIFDGIQIGDENHLINVVSQSPVGSTVEIVVWRDRQRHRLNATLSSWESLHIAVSDSDDVLIQTPPILPQHQDAASE